MPVYEYECRGCGHAFEEWQKINDAPVRICPKCKKRKVERLISQTSFQLRGGGWYGDLYASKKPPSSGDKPAGDTAAGAGEGAKAEAKAETKSETKSEGKSEAKTKDSGSKETGPAPAPAKKDSGSGGSIGKKGGGLKAAGAST